jgi:hypothetical protein
MQTDSTTDLPLRVSAAWATTGHVMTATNAVNMQLRQSDLLFPGC